ncbi:MAG TPA: branched-chain amino acid ABC transporter ATP-binding protein/permease [Candidatus Methylomirabilis sp.]|nr:branched-chain amino acid ABC transporter ATP-binding protein/permease [Candidatus Methylomirabilis sp.]
MIWRHPLLLLAFGLAVLPGVMPYFGTTVSVATEIAIFALVGFAYNLLLGYTGLASFGHGAYLGLAAYAAALTQIHLVKGFLTPLLVGVGTAALLGAVLGFLILRRRGVYFALLTLAFTQMFFYIVYRWTAVTGGESGLGGIIRPPLPGLDLTHQLTYYYVTAALVFAGALLTWRIVHAPFGAVLQAIRENERRAIFVGYPVQRYKWLAFVLSTALTGVAGVLFCLLKQFVFADLVHVTMSGEILAMAIVGGMRHFLGPAVGAAFFLLLREVLTSFTQDWLLYFGLLFMAFILFSPDGILGILRRLGAPLRREAAELAAMAGRIVPAPGSDGLTLPGGGERPPLGAVLLEARGVTKRFGRLPAVDQVDLEVRAGELRAVIGPNGAGKTTLFNILSGLFPPDAGSVLFRGRAITGLRPDRIVALGVSRSFQILSTFQELTVFENIRLAVQARSPRRFHLWRAAAGYAAVTRETEELIRLVGLRGVESVRASALSYGGQRLLEIGLALATRPVVLLLDEPLAGLSTAERERVAAFIRGLSHAVTVVLIEHDIDRVLALSDRITVLHLGRVIADGTPAEIQAHPEVRAAYLGGRGAPRPAAPAAPVPAVAPLLGVSGVDTFYGKSHILHDVSLEVRPGEVVALLGRNGAGKTATLNTIMGLRPPRRGSIRFRGREIAGLSPEAVARLGIGLAPQGRRVFPNLTVAENLRLARLARDGTGRARWDEARVAERFPRLRELARARAEVLSGGEQQMLAIARALVGNVELLLLDEPFEGLAPAVVEVIFETVEGLRGETAILLVEHNLDLALALADRVYVLDRGAVTHKGPARRLLEDLDLRRQVLWF